MPGTLNVGGHNIITHSGTSGAGDVTINVQDRLVLDSSGNVGIGTSPSYPFQVGSSDLIIDSSGNLLVETTDIDAGIGDTSGTDTQASYRPSQGYRQKNGTNFYNRTATGDFYRFRYQNVQVGSISIGATSTGFNTSSDYRLKENITDITDGISRVKQLSPSRFNFIADPDVTVDGFLAHEVSDIIPEAVSGEKDAVNEDGSINPQGIDQSKLVPLLTAALKESIALIESQQSQIDTLTAKTQEQDLTIASLISRIEALENA